MVALTNVRNLNRTKYESNSTVVWSRLYSLRSNLIDSARARVHGLVVHLALRNQPATRHGMQDCNTSMNATHHT